MSRIPLTLLIALLIATVMTFTRAAQDRELVAIRAAGIPPRVPMLSAVLVGIFLSVAASFANHYLIPEVHYRKYRVIADVVRSAFTNLNLGGDRIKVLDTGYIVTFRERSKETGEYLDCTIYSPRPIGRGLQSPIVYVDRVSVPPLEESNPQGDLRIVLSGVRDPIGGFAPDTLTFRVPIDELGSRGGRAHKDDGRAFAVELTDAGTALLAEAEDLVAAADAAFHTPLGPDADAFGDALRLIAGIRPRRRVKAVSA